MKLASLNDAVAHIPSTARIFVQGAAATPNATLETIAEEADRFDALEFIHLHVDGPLSWAGPEHADRFRVVNLFVSAGMRPHMGRDNVDYLPCFLSEIPRLFSSGLRKIDVAIVQVSPPDVHGFCTLGVSVDVCREAIEAAELVIAQINPNMPRAHGDAFVHVDEITIGVHVDDPLQEYPPRELSEAELAIGRNVAELVPDRACIQLGIGSIPDAVCASLKDHRELGLHSEMWSDGALDLILSGAITNEHKKVHPGKSIAAFLMGSRRLYDFVDDNPAVNLLDASYVNRPNVIARNRRVCAINSAVEVDLTGQICADSVGQRIISGVGGQMDFMRGASLSEEGVPIIALPSTTRRGESRIVPHLREGAGVVTTRAHAHWIVTEYGAAQLYAKSLRERARALIEIAHPDHREGLERALNGLGG